MPNFILIAFKYPSMVLIAQLENHKSKRNVHGLDTFRQSVIKESLVMTGRNSGNEFLSLKTNYRRLIRLMNIILEVFS